jgi:RHS repeat-associated protein
MIRSLGKTSDMQDAARNLWRTIDRRGWCIEYAYDAVHRTTGEFWYADETAAEADTTPGHDYADRAFSFEYNADGQLTRAADLDSATYTYAYDSEYGRVYWETQDLAGLMDGGYYDDVVLSPLYDYSSRRTDLYAYVGGGADFHNDYVYDGLGRLTRLTQSGYAVANKRVDFTYDAAGQYDTIARYASEYGIVWDEVATGTYSFDDAGRLTGLVYTQPNSSDLPGHEWTFDQAGRMTQMVSLLDGTADYANDDAGELTAADYVGDWQPDEGYQYDDNGNRTYGGYSTGPCNQLVCDGTYWYSYDAEGNRESRFVWIDTLPDTIIQPDEMFDLTRYTWDHRDRLTKVEHFADGGPETLSNWSVEYVYDYANRMIKRTLDPDGAESSEGTIHQTYYIYDGSQVILQFDKDGTGPAAMTDLSHRYLWNPQAVDQLFADEQVESLYSPGEVLWPLTDHQNTVRDLATYDFGTDETTVVNHRVFDAFGNITFETNSAVDCLFGYTGRMFDEATGLQNNLHRWYDARVARWASEDPIVFAAGDANLYRYVGNNPLAYTDPVGLRPGDQYREVPPKLGTYYRVWRGGKPVWIEGPPMPPNTDMQAVVTDDGKGNRWQAWWPIRNGKPRFPNAPPAFEIWIGPPITQTPRWVPWQPRPSNPNQNLPGIPTVPGWWDKRFPPIPTAPRQDPRLPSVPTAPGQDPRLPPVPTVPGRDPRFPPVPTQSASCAQSIFIVS